MVFTKFYAFLVLFQIYNFQFNLAKEPVCSKFAYEEQLLEKMIRTEIKVENIANEIKVTQKTVMDTLRAIKETVQDFTDKFDNLEQNITNRMSENTQVIEKKLKFFEKVYGSMRVNFTTEIENQRSSFVDFREHLEQMYDSAKKNFTTEIEHQRNSFAALQDKLERSSVAFCVHHVTEFDQDQTGKVIVFNTVITNEGSGYDTSTGVFTAPVGGLYQFTVHLCTPVSKYTYAGIAHNGRVVIKKFIFGVGMFAECSSVGGVVRVESGDQVWVQCTSGSSDGKLTESIGSSRMNIFFGILINS